MEYCEMRFYNQQPMTQTLPMPNSLLQDSDTKPFPREISYAQVIPQVTPQQHDSPSLSKQTPSQPLQCLVAQLNATIQQLSMREAILTQQLQSCTQLLKKYREESDRLGAKVEQLEGQLAKDHNRSTSGQEGSSLCAEQDNFGIGDEDEIDIGQSCNNLQLKESFNILRCSIEKLFNEEEITLSVVRLLPKQLEDDFHDFVGYVREKIVEIRNSNNLSYIEAENGQEPSLLDLEQELQEFMAVSASECNQLKQVIEEKECTITSLMNEKTEHENTIGEQQVAQEETERLYLQQFAVLKGEIQQQKQAIDRQTVYHESLRNILKKMMHLWIDDEDNFDDFEDNLTLVTTLYAFSPKEMDLLRKYLAKYKELKCIDQ